MQDALAAIYAAEAWGLSTPSTPRVGGECDDDRPGGAGKRAAPARLQRGQTTSALPSQHTSGSRRRSYHGAQRSRGLPAVCSGTGCRPPNLSLRLDYEPTDSAVTGYSSLEISLERDYQIHAASLQAAANDLKRDNSKRNSPVLPGLSLDW
jgi:hypothetical protein